MKELETTEGVLEWANTYASPDAICQCGTCVSHRHDAAVAEHIAENERLRQAFEAYTTVCYDCQNNDYGTHCTCTGKTAGNLELYLLKAINNKEVEK